MTGRQAYDDVEKSPIVFVREGQGKDELVQRVLRLVGGKNEDTRDDLYEIL